MDWKVLPSLNALRAFAALADCGSYSEAGRALNVTHAAVMQQVKALEKRFGLALVLRSGRGIALTPDGAALATALEAGFARIARGVQAVKESGESQPVQVTMSPVFAVKWLMPRIADFQNRHPEITLMLNPTGRIVDLRRGGMDLAIRYAPAGQEPRDATVLIKLDLGIMGVPSLLDPAKVKRPADLLGLPWLQELGTNEVGEWCARRGMDTRPALVSHMPGNLIMEAVTRGDGITFTARQWLASELHDGTLIEVFPEEKSGLFYLHTPPGEPHRGVRTFMAWLKKQAAG
ncbi:LysR family transcriptional regulator [Alisedimentitalea sp. MJ-SS2]|uniref:LysR family transcriptional regulator n=1 Tax=Aliisedimentitalea sp. MJ-SS2 TaxID=3049795 RepID=UPI00290A34B7|nr:LysR family transcriptional regulator [Alisedimentitalea sp. MJ-SS2]MDU8928920.1 LysR family transcriptional regulator [Alisedimentitalea sp. MJ-SS2]